MTFFIFCLGLIALPLFAQQEATTPISAHVPTQEMPEELFQLKPTEALTSTCPQTTITQQLTDAQQALANCQQKQRQQAVLKDFFEQALHKQKAEKTKNNKILNTIFKVLGDQLPNATYYQLSDHQLVISTDAILVPGRGEVSTSGKTRLQLMANALRAASALIPADTPWFWRITGHADNQPLRRINWFPSNWELSAARAGAVLRYLIDQGISAKHLGLAALGNTQLLVPDATDKAGHARNRRVVIELIIQ